MDEIVKPFDFFAIAYIDDVLIFETYFLIRYVT